MSLNSYCFNELYISTVQDKIPIFQFPKSPNALLLQQHFEMFFNIERTFNHNVETILCRNNLN